MARQRVRLKRTTLVAVWCVAFLSSVGFAHAGHWFELRSVWPALLVLFLGLNFYCTRYLLVAIIFGLILGIFRAQSYEYELFKYQKYYDQKVIITVTAAEDGYYDKYSQTSFSAKNIKVNGESLKGKIKIGGFGANAIFEGDEILAEGKLREGFAGTQGSMGFAKMQVIRHHNNWIAELRRKFGAGIKSTLPEPLASFAMGILIGQRVDLPQDVKDELKMVGLTHIIAVSGYNLTVILRAVHKATYKFSRRLGLVSCLALIALFLLMTGMSASIVRASMVSVLSLLAGYYGRTFKSLNIILLTAALTAFWSPFYIWGDLSWYLSFLAFSGVIVLAPMINKKDSIIKGMIVETMCAEIMTLPIILYSFGQMTLVGLPSNMLIVSLVPVAMFFSFICGLFGMFFAGISGWVAWPAVLVLNFILDSAHVISSIPNIFITNLGFSALQMTLVYMAICVFAVTLHVKTKKQSPVKITDKELITN